MRTSRIGILIAVATLALGACATIPDHGQVREGDSDVAQPAAPLPILEGPEPGASARSIVQGFLTAAAGGSVSTFDVARKFLSADASAEWDPLDHVTVFDSREVVPRFDESTGTFVYSVPVAAVVDSSGVMTEAGPDIRSDLSFTVAKDDTGELRITSLDDGILVSAADFERFFRPVNLYFSSSDRTTLVPDLRWFASNDQIATAAAKELVEGPSVWLADGVVTGFPAGSALAVDAVVVDEGKAAVSLAPGSAGNAADRSLAGEQLRATLTQLPNVQSVVATIGTGVPLGGDGSASLVAAPLPDENAVVAVEGRLGVFDGEEVKALDADGGTLPQGAHGLALGYDGSSVAFNDSDGISFSDALSKGELTPVQADHVVQEASEVARSALIAGKDLVNPSFDRFGWVWTAASASDGNLVVGMPGADAMTLPMPTLAGASIQAVAVSRDGARVAILSRSSGEQTLEVASIVRDASGAPLGIGNSLVVGTSLRPAVDLTWVDEDSVATLGEESGEISLVQIGGWTTDVTSVSTATSVTARNGLRTLLTVEGNGNLLVRSGSGWTPKATGVSDVAYAG